MGSDAMEFKLSDSGESLGEIAFPASGQLTEATAYQTAASGVDSERSSAEVSQFSLLSQVLYESVFQIGIDPEFDFLPAVVGGIEADAKRLGLTPTHGAAHGDARQGH
jgi:hypothetical protein